MNETPVIKIRTESKKLLERLANDYKRSQLDFISDLVLYINKNQIDIYDQGDDTALERIKKLENRIIGFLRKRETDFFADMKEAFMSMTREHRDTRELVELYFNPERNNLNQTINTNSPTLKVPGMEASQKTSESSTTSTFKQEAPSGISDSIYEEKYHRLLKEHESIKSKCSDFISRIKPGGAINRGFTINTTQTEIDQLLIQLR